VAKSYRLKVIDHESCGWDFPTGAKKKTVFEVVDPLNVFFHHSHTQKALPCVKTRRLSINQQYWFRRSTCGRAQEKKRDARRLD